MPSPPVLDSSAEAYWSSAASNATALSLTTTQANDIIVVIAAAEKSGLTELSVSGITNTGAALTWAKRSAIQGAGGSSYNALECWWALAASAGTYGITVTFDQVIDDASLVAFGVSGTLTSAPWDATALTTGQGPASPNSNPPSLSGITTANAALFVFSAVAADYPFSTGSPTAGYSIIRTALNGGAILWEYLDTEGLSTSTPLIGATVAWGAGEHYGGAWGVNQWSMIVDALTSGGGGGGAPPVLTGTSRFTQVSVEALESASPKARVAGATVEVLRDGSPRANVAGAFLEALRNTSTIASSTRAAQASAEVLESASPALRIGQSVVEVLEASPTAPPPARFGQAALEVLRSRTPPVWIAQSVLEVLENSPATAIVIRPYVIVFT